MTRTFASLSVLLLLALSALAGPGVRAQDLASQAVATGLEHPWALAFLPGGRFLVTERPGRLRVVAADGRIGNPVTGVPAVAAWGAATKSMFRKPAVTTAGP